MTAHTPGPWYVEQNDDPRAIDEDCGRRVDKYAGLGIVGPEGQTVCTWIVDHYALCDDSTVPSEANARLIASAPDLLAACKALVAPFSTPDAYDAAYDAALAAIRKAEG